MVGIPRLLTTPHKLEIQLPADGTAPAQSHSCCTLLLPGRRCAPSSARSSRRWGLRRCRPTTTWRAASGTSTRSSSRSSTRRATRTTPSSSQVGWCSSVRSAWGRQTTHRAHCAQRSAHAVCALCSAACERGMRMRQAHGAAPAHQPASLLYTCLRRAGDDPHLFGARGLPAEGAADARARGLRVGRVSARARFSAPLPT